MESIYKYSILKYRHSLVLGEELNIGLVIFFESNNELCFIFDSKLIRPKAIYENIPERVIRNYLREINNKLNQFNKELNQFEKLEIRSSLTNFLQDNILQIDSSALQFSMEKTAYQYQVENKKIKDYLTENFLLKNHTSSIDKEYEIGKEFYNKVKPHVKEEGKSNNPNFYRDYKIQNETGIDYTFKYAWQNGSLNLVKPLNFDLNEPRYISRKAHQNYGLFIDLDSVETLGKHKYDLLIKRPSKKQLFKEYDHSLSLLSKIKKVRIFEENKIPEYTRNLIRTIAK